MKKFAVFDIDGTLIRWQLYHAIVNELAKRGHLNEDAYVSIKESRMLWKQRSHENSFREYENAVIAAYHAAITDLMVDNYQDAVECVFNEYKDQVYTFTRDLLWTLKQQGYLLFTISGSQQEIIQKLADYYGFDDAIGNQYEIVNGRFTGKHQKVVESKGKLLEHLIKKHSATLTDSVAVGDSESDIPLLAAVERPIAFNPTKSLLQEAHKHGWKIVVERKNNVYTLEGSPNGRYWLSAESL